MTITVNCTATFQDDRLFVSHINKGESWNDIERESNSVLFCGVYLDPHQLYTYQHTIQNGVHLSGGKNTKMLHRVIHL